MFIFVYIRKLSLNYRACSLHKKIWHVDKLRRPYHFKLNYHFCLFCFICLKAVGLPVSIQVPVKANKKLFEQSIR